MSNPWEKMVLVVNPQPNELEQKKKRQTLERAKANHLSKQLQMRLQYAKLKVEHGWQRQNLNEVENLYFHHSHLRSMRQGAAQRPQYATVTYPAGTPVPTETHGPSPTPSGVPDRTAGPSPSAVDASSTDPVSPPSQSPSEHVPPSQPHHSVQTPVPVAPVSTATNHPPSVLDLSDPNILARLVQLQAQVQPQSQPQAQTPSRLPSTTIPSSTSISVSQPISVPVPVPVSHPIPAPGVFSPHVQLSQPSTSHPQPGFIISAFAPQPPPGAFSIYPIPPGPSQPPVPTSTTAIAPSPIAPIPATSIPTSAPIAPTALTYDSFWSTHASSTGSTRALYRTHTGFTASATPGGNVAMLTPGGHAAIMTAEGVYVGGGSK